MGWKAGAYEKLVEKFSKYMIKKYSEADAPFLSNEEFIVAWAEFRDKHRREPYYDTDQSPGLLR